MYMFKYICIYVYQIGYIFTYNKYNLWPVGIELSEIILIYCKYILKFSVFEIIYHFF